MTGQGRWHTTSVQILDAQSAAHLLLQVNRAKKITEKKITRSRGVGLASPLSHAGLMRGFSGSEASIL